MLPPEARPCPFCSQEMERGYLQTDGRQMGFLPDPPPIARLRLDYNLWTPIQHGQAFLPGLRCPECRHIEVEYREPKSTESKFERVPDGPE